MKVPAMKLPKLPVKKPAKTPTRPLDEYRSRPNHLHAAGGAYLVLPYGLLYSLPPERQQQLVDLLATINRQRPSWSADTVYQVLPWARIRPGDLDAQELAWHNIVGDVDAATGAMSYSRAGTPVPADTVLGHRPAIDTVPRPPGTSPGVRPPLLPAAPDSPVPPGPPALSPALRSVRAARIVQTRRRREAIAAFAPTIDTDWAHALSVTDDLWGTDEQWKQLARQNADVPQPAAVPPPEPVLDVDQEPQPPALSTPESAGNSEMPPSAPEATRTGETAASSADDWEADIAALSADLEGMLGQ